MSDLKHQSIDELKQSLEECTANISRLKSSLIGQENRLQLIIQYVFQKTPVKMTMGEIENKLGHKVILK